MRQSDDVPSPPLSRSRKNICVTSKMAHGIRVSLIAMVLTLDSKRWVLAISLIKRQTKAPLQEIEEEMERNFQEIEEQNGNNFVDRYNGDGPPTDDVCPICLDLFTIPCRSNCRHWFCANCILQFWMYISVIQPCKCPLCGLPITNLVLDMSQLVQPGEDVEEVIRNVKHYNLLFVGGLHAFFLKVLMLPFFIKKAIRFLMDLEALTCVLCVMRFVGLLLILFYGMKEFQFTSIGAFGIIKIFEVEANLLLASLFVYNMWQRWELRGLERRLADLQQRNALIDLQQRDAWANLEERDALDNLQEQDA